MKKICITGHRNCNLSQQEIDTIIKNTINNFDDVIFVTGGAAGFDLLIEQWCNNNSIDFITIRPDYEKYFYKQAPLERNKIMVDMCDLVLAYYDGRKTGGTYYTINYARKNKKPVFIIR